MVVALADELLHLCERVLPAARHMLCDIGDLSPDDKTVLIAEVIEFLRVLVMGKAQRVGAELADDFHIRCVILIGKSVALALEVLMAAHAA